MIRTHRIWAAAALIAITAARGAAQEPDLAAAIGAVPPGTTLSVRDADGARTTGRLVNSTGGLLTLTTQDGKSVAVPLDRVRRVVHVDSSRNGTWMGAAIGGAVGLASGLALNSLYANEGSGSGAGVLLLAAGGFGVGAAVGGLADAMRHHTLYNAEPGTPGDYAGEVRARIALDAHGNGNLPVSLGASWRTVHVDSGLGFEANIDNTFGAADGTGRGFSTDFRVVYAFGKARVQPFASAGVGYFETNTGPYTYVTPSIGDFPGGVFQAIGRAQGFAPIVGGGATIRLSPKLFVRPEVSFYDGRDKVRGFKTGVGLGFSW